MTSQIQTVRAEISELRGEMNAMESNLHGEISTVRSEMNAKISALETRLVQWILVIFFSGMRILFAALRLFPG